MVEHCVGVSVYFFSDMVVVVGSAGSAEEDRVDEVEEEVMADRKSLIVLTNGRKDGRTNGCEFKTSLFEV